MTRRAAAPSGGQLPGDQPDVDRCTALLVGLAGGEPPRLREVGVHHQAHQAALAADVNVTEVGGDVGDGGPGPGAGKQPDPARPLGHQGGTVGQQPDIPHVLQAARDLLHLHGRGDRRWSGGARRWDSGRWAGNTRAHGGAGSSRRAGGDEQQGQGGDGAAHPLIIPDHGVGGR